MTIVAATCHHIAVYFAMYTSLRLTARSDAPRPGAVPRCG